MGNEPLDPYNFKVSFNPFGHPSGGGWYVGSCNSMDICVLCVGGEIVPSGNYDRAEREHGTEGAYYYKSEADAKAALAAYLDKCALGLGNVRFVMEESWVTNI